MKNSFGQDIKSIKVHIRYWQSKTTLHYVFDARLFSDSELLVRLTGSSLTIDLITANLLKKGITTGKLPKPNKAVSSVASYAKLVGVGFSYEEHQMELKRDVTDFM